MCVSVSVACPYDPKRCDDLLPPVRPSARPSICCACECLSTFLAFFLSVGCTIFFERFAVGAEGGDSVFLCRDRFGSLRLLMLFCCCVASLFLALALALAVPHGHAYKTDTHEIVWYNVSWSWLLFCCAALFGFVCLWLLLSLLSF